MTVAAAILVVAALALRAPDPAPIIIVEDPQRVGGGAALGGLERLPAVEEPADMEIGSMPSPSPSSPLHRRRPLEYGTGQFTWMAASLPDLAEARARVARFRSQGYNSNVAPRLVRGQQFYGVTLGLFPSRATAEVYRSRLPPEVQARDDVWLLSLDEASSSPPAQGRTAWVDSPQDGYLALRQRATKQSSEVSRIPHGSAVTVLSCNAQASGARGQWCRVAYDGLQGWSYSLYLDF